MRIEHFDKFFDKKFTLFSRDFLCNSLGIKELQHPTRTGVYACVQTSTHACARLQARTSVCARIILLYNYIIYYTILTCSVSMLLYRVITHTKPIIPFHYVTRNCK